MIQSMTAFARFAEEAEAGAIVWEIRTLNHRYLDIHLKLPESLRSFDGTIRECIAKHIKRGKVDVLAYFRPSTMTTKSLSLNRPLFDNVLALVNEAAADMATPAPVSPLDLLQWPNMVISNVEPPETLRVFIVHSLEQALNELLKHRQAEGTKLKDFISKQCQQVDSLSQEIRTHYPEAIASYRQKLLDRLAEFDVAYDPNRLEQELIQIKQKTDITEELDRIHIHLSEVDKALQQSAANGRRLDFLMQELNREVNTIAAKSHAAFISQLSVELKVIIDQMREQIQNIQ